MAGIALLLGWETLALGIFILSFVAALCLRRSLLRPPHPLSWLGHIQLLALCWLPPIVREGARLRGMVTLGARPSWHPTLREVFEPSKPRRISIPLGEWAFWSESGATRETLLRHLTEVLKTSGHETQMDTGWRRFDLETPPQSSLTVSFLTMTECHSNGRTLTRVSTRLRIPGWVGFLALALLAQSFKDLTQGDVGGAAVPAVILFLLFSLRINLASMLFKATGQSGMKPT